MSKRDTGWNEEKYKRYIRAGKGQGEGKNYKSWLSIQDFASRGRVCRVLGWKTGRMYNFFTDIETKCFYIFEWEDSIIDIREHFPLLDMAEIIEKKDDLRFDMFKDKESSYPYVLTTTFLLTVNDKDNRVKYLARSVKSYSELSKKTTQEKLEIERRFWLAKGINWGIITQREIPVNKVKNIEWIHSTQNEYKDYDIGDSEMIELCKMYLSRIDASYLSIRKFNKDFDVANGLNLGTALFIFKYLIASKILSINIDKVIDLNSTFDELLIRNRG